nr:ATP synthase F0 subunit b [Ceramothamnion sp.]
MLKNTYNFTFFLIAFLLVKFNIILLNEETLILIVFSAFCVLSTFRLRSSVEKYFSTQLVTIQSNLFLSNSKLTESFSSQSYNIDISSNWVNEFLKLKTHLKTFNNLIFNNLIKFYQFTLFHKLQKKLIFSKRLEQQISKLVSLIILEKLTKNLQTKKFCENTLLLKKFKVVEKFYFREYLKKIF